MIKKNYRDKTPQLDPSVRAAENCAVIGGVTCEKDVNIWYGAVLRADAADIYIGEGTNIQDGCVIHCDADRPVQIGKGVVIGHGAILHSCTVGDDCLIGMGAVLLSGCRVGAGSMIGAGALVTGKMDILPGSLVLGSPAKVVREVTPEQREEIRLDAQSYVLAAAEELDRV